MTTDQKNAIEYRLGIAKSMGETSEGLTAFYAHDVSLLLKALTPAASPAPATEAAAETAVQAAWWASNDWFKGLQEAAEQAHKEWSQNIVGWHPDSNLEGIYGHDKTDTAFITKARPDTILALLKRAASPVPVTAGFPITDCPYDTPVMALHDGEWVKAIRWQAPADGNKSKMEWFFSPADSDDEPFEAGSVTAWLPAPAAPVVATDQQNPLVAFLLSSDTGVSSKAIAARYAGQAPQYGYYGHPYDSADFGRCHRLLQLVPAIDIAIMRGASATWDKLADAWAELTTAYEKSDWKGFEAIIQPIMRPTTLAEPSHA